MSWISRSSHKLVYGLQYFSIAPVNLVTLDIGCATGGFTHVLLASGAKRVYAVDVSYGHLALQLRYNSRVVALERTNARYLSSAEIPELVNLIVCDVSFISLKIIFPALLPLTYRDARLIALVKPQFEIGRNYSPKNGIITNLTEQIQICAETALWIRKQLKWRVLGIIESPILGTKGNREFILGAERYD